MLINKIALLIGIFLFAVYGFICFGDLIRKNEVPFIAIVLMGLGLIGIVQYFIF